jgi:CheY-like chemotaxis protein
MNNSILLVDDVQMFLDIQAEFLQESNVTILTARNGMEALEFFRNNQIPDLVFMDLHMPKMDGATCCKSIKNSPHLAKLPVVMVTGIGKKEDIETSFSAGCDDFLTKPLDRNIFLEVARRFIPDIERRERRIPIYANGVFSTENESVECHVDDLSTGGVHIVSDHKVTPRQILRLHFNLPDGSTIDCSGRVSWLDTDDCRAKGFGVQFALLSKKEKDKIACFITANYIQTNGAEI